MVELINASGYDYITNGSLLEGIKITLESTFLGAWIWLMLIISIDMVVYIKTRNPLLTSTLNLILVYLFMSSLPSTAFMFVLIPSVLALAGSIWFVFR